MQRDHISDTTRPPKENEIDGEHYRFVTFEEFKALEENAMLLEHGTYKGSYFVFSCIRDIWVGITFALLVLPNRQLLPCIP